jgi:hypothetical protein
VITRIVAMIVLVAMAGIAATVSYSHMQELAESAGEGWRSYLIPLCVDGLILSSALVVFVRRQLGAPVSYLAVAGLATGILASVAANAADARPEVTAILVAGWAPVAFAWAFELIKDLWRLRTEHEDSPATKINTLEERPTPDPVDQFGPRTRLIPRPERAPDASPPLWQPPGPPVPSSTAMGTSAAPQPSPAPKPPVLSTTDESAPPVTPPPSTQRRPEPSELPSSPDNSPPDPPSVPSPGPGSLPTRDQILEALDAKPVDQTLAQLAGCLGISESHLYRVKRSRTNGSPVGTR